MLLRITDGAVTVTLQDNDNSPTAGLAGALYFPTEGDGVTATETIEVRLSGASSLALVALNNIRRLLSRASIEEVYLEYAMAGDTPYRSRVLSGKVGGSDNPLWRDFSQNEMVGEAAVIITRVDYWEGPEETLASAVSTRTNGNGSPYNILDFTTPSGNLPTPIKVSLKNTNGAALQSPVVYLNVDTWAGLFTNQHLVTPGAGASSWGANLTHGQLLWICTIPNATIAKLAGLEVNIIAGFTSIPTTLYLRANLYSLYEGVYMRVATGAEKYSNGIKLQNLGTLPIPRAANGGLVLAITGYSAAAGSATMSFCQLAPASGAVRLDVSHEWEINEWVVFNGIEGTAYYDSGSNQYSNVRATGGPLMAWPGKNNRLHVLFAESANYVASRQWVAEIKARPRRATV